MGIAWGIVLLVFAAAGAVVLIALFRRKRGGNDHRIAIRVVAVLAVACLLIGLIVLNASLGKEPVSADRERDASPSATPTPTRSPSATPTPTRSSPAPTPPNLEDLDQQAQDRAPEYTDDQIVVTTDPDLDQKEERGSTWFNEETLKNRADIVAFINGNGERNVEARIHVLNCIRDSGYGEDEVQRALNGEGFAAAMQLEVASQIMGNTYFKDGQVWDGNEWRSVGEGDFFWLFVARDGKIVWCATLRADCANPGLDEFRPVTTATPSAPVAGTPSRTSQPVTSSSSTPPRTSAQTPTTTARPSTPTTPPTTRPTTPPVTTTPVTTTVPPPPDKVDQELPPMEPQTGSAPPADPVVPQPSAEPAPDGPENAEPGPADIPSEGGTPLTDPATDRYDPGDTP